MLFNSLHFVVFFIIVTAIYFIIPHRYRWFLLLVSSCYFYMIFVPIYILILAFTIIIDYYAGIFIENNTGKIKKLSLVISIVANVGILAFFKYFNFLNENLTEFLNIFNTPNPVPYLSIILPVGLSFHTFKAMSYTIEVYRGTQKAEHHLGIYALYEMFYPLLIAGPIERPQNLLHQFHEKHLFEYKNATEGLKLMLWGFFMKIVIADRLAIYVDAIYNNPEYHTGLSILVATLFFAFQIYCDFAGYSLIAIGASRVMGFKIMNNFNLPYFSKTISEFWSRWHISLSTWLRDYIFFPSITTLSEKIKGNKKNNKKRSMWIYSFSIFITFFISGVWHGANWTFIMLGIIHGFYLIFAVITKRIRIKIEQFTGINSIPFLKNLIQILVTFVLVNFAFIFFRARNVEEAFFIIKKISTFSGPIFYEDVSMLILSIFGIVFLLITEIKSEYYHGSISFFKNKNWLVRSFSYATLLILIILIGVFDGGQFIYFQF